MKPSEAGDPEFGDLLMEYLPRLLRLAEANMSPRIKAKVGAEDMVHSVLGSVIRMERLGKLDVEKLKSEDCWQLLQVIALCKIRKKVRALNTRKRNINRELAITSDSPPLEELAIDSVAPDQEDGRWFGKVLDQLRDSLDDNALLVLEGKLAGDRALQIAKRLSNGSGMSTKTVTRLWGEIQRKAEEIANEDEVTT